MMTASYWCVCMVVILSSLGELKRRANQGDGAQRKDRHEQYSHQDGQRAVPASVVDIVVDDGQRAPVAVQPGEPEQQGVIDAPAKQRPACLDDPLVIDLRHAVDEMHDRQMAERQGDQQHAGPAHETPPEGRLPVDLGAGPCRAAGGYFLCSRHGGTYPSARERIRWPIMMAAAGMYSSATSANVASVIGRWYCHRRGFQSSTATRMPFTPW